MEKPSSWLAGRTAAFDASGIRRVFDLAASLSDPINLSIGQPDFDVPDSVKQACCQAIQQGKNGYSQTQGIGPLREQLQAQIDERFGHDDRKVLITSGTSGGLLLSMLAMVDPGDEVIYFDPFFVMYPALIRMAGGIPVAVGTYPDFQIDPEKLKDAVTSKTKLILLNSPANPTGVVASPQRVTAVAEIARRNHIALISDEIYSQFVYDGDLATPADANPDTLVIDGFSKSHAMTGWRVGWAHGPAAVIEAMAKLQQYSFVCAPQPAQWAALEALRVDLGGHRDQYRQKRDRIVAGLKDHYDLVEPGGAFYLFPAVPNGQKDTEFVARAIENNLLIIPGSVFSQRHSHFRISYAASDETIDRGIQVLQQLARS